MGIIRSLRKREGRKPQAGTTVTMAPRHSAETRPQLMLMLPDATGIAAYQLNQFPSAKAAEFFLDSSLRGRKPESSVMFWALTWQPTADADTEPLVLIRDTRKPIIYPFSFSDIDSAFEFVRHEMHRGLHLSQVMIYWAVPAHIEVDFWGRSTIQPAEAPASPTVISTSIAEPVLSSDAAVETVAPSTVTEGEGARYLADDDIAETVRQAKQAASKSPPPDDAAAAGRVVLMPVPAPLARKSKKQKTAEDATPIDFPSASQRVQEGRLARAAGTAWRNFSLAVDEALDVYVARQVATKLAWNRITRALSQAMDAQQQAEIEAAERKACEEAAHGKKTAAADVIEEVEVVEVTLAPPPWLIAEVKMRAEFLPDEMAEEAIVETITPLEGEFAEALLAAVDAVNLDDVEEPFDEDTPDEQVHTPLFPGLWRSHAADRWQPREAPFKGFGSPPDRF